MCILDRAPGVPGVPGVPTAAPAASSGSAVSDPSVRAPLRYQKIKKSSSGDAPPLSRDGENHRSTDDPSHGEESNLSSSGNNEDKEESSETRAERAEPRAKRRSRANRRKTNSANFEENQKIMQEVRTVLADGEGEVVRLEIKTEEISLLEKGEGAKGKRKKMKKKTEQSQEEEVGLIRFVL